MMVTGGRGSVQVSEAERRLNAHSGQYERQIRLFSPQFKQLPKLETKDDNMATTGHLGQRSGTLKVLTMWFLFGMKAMIKL